MWNESSKESDITKLSIPKLKEFEIGLEPFRNPILLQNGSGSILLIFSKIKEEIILLTGKSILSRFELKEGINEVKLSSNLTEYSNIKVKFTTSIRTVKLR